MDGMIKLTANIKKERERENVMSFNTSARRLAGEEKLSAETVMR